MNSHSEWQDYMNTDASTFASEVYLYRIQSGDYVDSKKAVLLRWHLNA